MKKKITKKLVLHKATISNLEKIEMQKVKGATLHLPVCTGDSCTLHFFCCTPTEENLVSPLLDMDID